MAAAYGSTGTVVAQSSGATLTLTRPTVAEGDWMIAVIVHGDLSASISDPDGWASSQGNSQSGAVRVSTKQATASEPSTYAWSVPSNQVEGQIVTVTGGGSGIVKGNFAAGSSGVVTATVTSVATGILVGFAGEDYAAVQTHSETGGGGYAEQVDYNSGASASNCGHAIYTKAGVAAGSQSIQITSTGASDIAGLLIAIPDGAAPPSDPAHTDGPIKRRETGDFADNDLYIRQSGSWQRVDVMYRRESGAWVRYM